MDRRQQQRDKQRKELEAIIQNHKDIQQKIIKDWNKALNKSRENTRQLFKQQKDGLTQESNDLKTRENQLIQELIQLEAQTKDEMTKLWINWETQLRSLMTQPSVPSDGSIDTLNRGVRDLQLQTCWDDTIRQITDAINRHKSRVNQLIGQSIDGQPAVPESSGQSSKLLEIRQQINKTVKEMADNDEEERKAIQRLIKGYTDIHKKNIEKVLDKYNPKPQPKQ